MAVIDSLIRAVERALDAEDRCRTLAERQDAERETNAKMRTAWPLLQNYWANSRGKAKRVNGH